MNAPLRAILLLALLAATASVARADDEDAAPAPAARIGAPAPDFDLRDVDGRPHRLADLRGRVVILEWTDNACPFVQKLYERTRRAQQTVVALRKLDPKAVWLSIDSTAGVTPARYREWVKVHDVTHPILLDADGAVAKIYGARRTPQIFVIDRKGILRFSGAVDDDRVGNKPSKDVRSAALQVVRQLQQKKPVDPASTKPYGCIIKRP